MPYTPVTFTDGTTPLNKATFDAMQAGIISSDANKVEINAVVVAAATLVANKLLAGDAQPSFRILGSGRLDWGPGGATAPDASLYRYGAGILGTNSGLVMAATDASLYLRGSTASRIFFGATDDANLYRVAAGVLQTDNQFRVPGVTGGTAPMGMSVGSNVGLPSFIQHATTSLSFYLGHNSWLRASDAQQIYADTHGSFGSRAIYMNFTGGISFYADAAAATAGNIVSAPERMRIANDGKIYIGSNADTNLYRYSPGWLKTDAVFACANFSTVIVAGAVGGAQGKRFAVFDNATGTLAGYVPLYAT